MKLLRRLQYLLNRSQHERELAEEMEFHRSMMEDPRGMGNTTLAREDARHVWLAPWIESVVQDLRYAFRSLRAQPGFTAMALLALTFGIGINTTLFTLYNAAANQLLPVPDAERMVAIRAVHPAFGYGGFSVMEYRHLAAHSRTLEGVFLDRFEPLLLDERPRSAHFVSGNYFAVLGVGMERGADFPAEDAPVVILSHRVWREQYNSDPAIVGRKVRLDDMPFTVAGVAEESFTGTSMDSYDLWVPLGALPLARPNDPRSQALLTNPGWCCSTVMGRLVPGVTRQQAEAELEALAAQFFQQNKQEARRVAIHGTAFLDDPNDRAQGMQIAALLFAAVGAILLLACANVGNLQLARAAARHREIGIRVAIGAGRLRVVRQLLTESLLLAGMASTVAFALAYVLPGMIAGRQLANLRLKPDGLVLAYSIGIAVFSALAFGLIPALRATRVSVSDAMKQAAHATPRFPLRAALLGVQVTISVVLLICAGLLVRGLQSARSLDPGFRTKGVSVAGISLPANQYNANRSQDFFDSLAAQLRQSIGRPVALAGLAPLGNGTSTTNFDLPGQEAGRNPTTLLQMVSPGYFETLGIPIVAGRDLIPEDRSRGGLVINQTLARRYWPGQNPVGQHAFAGSERLSVVGVAQDAQVYGLGRVQPILFRPFTGTIFHGTPVLLVPTDSAAVARATILRMEPRARVETITLSEQVDRWLGDTRTAVRAASGLGGLALLLATIGVYGVISYSVEQRRKEIGIRMALGARPPQVVRLILRRNTPAILCGLAAGIGIAVLASRALERELYGVSRLDPLAYAAVFLILLGAGAAASVIPSRRAARTDAASVLQEQ